MCSSLPITNNLPMGNASLPILSLVISSPLALVVNVLPIINLPMAMGNLPIAAKGLTLVPIGDDIQDIG